MNLFHTFLLIVNRQMMILSKITVLDEMKETISNVPAFNPLEDKQTFRPPIPTELLTVDPSAAVPPTNCPAEDALSNADESDESTGQVELNTFKTKITRVNPGLLHRLRPSRALEVRE